MDRASGLCVLAEAHRASGIRRERCPEGRCLHRSRQRTVSASRLARRSATICARYWQLTYSHNAHDCSGRSGTRWLSSAAKSCLAWRRQRQRAISPVSSRPPATDSRCDCTMVGALKCSGAPRIRHSQKQLLWSASRPPLHQPCERHRSRGPSPLLHRRHEWLTGRTWRMSDGWGIAPELCTSRRTERSIPNFAVRATSADTSTCDESDRCTPSKYMRVQRCSLADRRAACMHSVAHGLQTGKHLQVC